MRTILWIARGLEKWPAPVSGCGGGGQRFDLRWMGEAFEEPSV